jgi:hypothetical protein
LKNKYKTEFEKLEDLIVQNSKEYKFWGIECDEGKDFKYYFNDANPSNFVDIRLANKSNQRVSKLTTFCIQRMKCRQLSNVW